MTLDDDLTEEELAKLAKDGSNEEKSAVARHPNTSLETLLTLAEGMFAEEVDQNPMLPLYVETGSEDAIEILAKVAEQTRQKERLDELASSVWAKVRFYVAKNKKTNPRTLHLLAQDKDAEVRIAVSHNDNTEKESLVLLANDEDAARVGAARNRNTPPESIEKLAKDRDRYVRRIVAMNDFTPASVLTMLAKDRHWDVRIAVASNSSTPLDTLKQLSKDADEKIRENATSTYKKVKNGTP